MLFNTHESLFNIDLKYCTQYKNYDKLFLLLSNTNKYIVKACNLSFLDKCCYLFIICLVFYICLLTYFGSNNTLAFLLQEYKNNCSNLFHFILVRFSSGHLSSVKFCLHSWGLTSYFLIIFMKCILKIYHIYFMDKVMEFLVGRSSLQRLCNYFKYLLFG